MVFKRLISMILLLSLTGFYFRVVPVSASGQLQIDPATRAQDLLNNLSPEERVGQLFLVAFSGTATDDKSSIFDLIANHHIGGVVLQAANDNFVAAPNTLQSTYQLISQLQSIDWQASLGPFTGNATSVARTNYIPLFTGISQDGDGFPNDQILSGLTSLPNPMAIGATWNVDLSQQVGAVAGQELSALGFNLFFGPPLDVLESPEATLGNGLDANVFGGDPYWVGVMGQAYINGVHSGSLGKMAVIAEHFPGRGSSDRPVGGEPATVRKSLEQLKQIELAPYFTVTGNAQDPQSDADGLQVSDIRYQGLQGNIRTTTRPMSFDPQALSTILTIPPFTTWHQNGGLLVSDDLGSQTVRSFYDPGNQGFNAQLVARDAFLAGNDVLYLGNIQSTNVPDNYNTVLNVLDFFVQKYNQDPTFAQRVDDSVLRILTVKYKLYGYFGLTNVIPPESGLNSIGNKAELTLAIARQSATLVSPDLADLDSVLPAPPSSRDRIVFLTDTRTQKQCSTCTETPMLGVASLENAILRLYGPGIGGQVSSSHMVSYSFDDMAALLEGGAGNHDEETSMNLAQWIIISMLDAEPNQPQTIELSRFLSERQDLLRDKRVILFSFNAPYYLDATDISKLTAYYCLYSKGTPFVEIAARLLFQEIRPTGALPVSVAGVGYDLFTATSPDPSQVINLSLDLPSVSATPGSGTPEVTSTPSYKVGDTVSVRTGIIVDQNQHPVPDGTNVRFTLSSSAEGGSIQEVDAVTAQGIAKASFSIARTGLLEIRAESDPATNSVDLQLTVSNEGFSVTVISPTQITEPTSTPKSVVTPLPPRPSPMEQGFPGFSGWLVTILFLAGLTYVSFLAGNKRASLLWGFRWGVCALLGGLVAYTYLALHLPGAVNLIQSTGLVGILGIALCGSASGLGIGYGWMLLASEKAKQSD